MSEIVASDSNGENAVNDPNAAVGEEGVTPEEEQELRIWMQAAISQHYRQKVQMEKILLEAEDKPLTTAALRGYVGRPSKANNLVDDEAAVEKLSDTLQTVIEQQELVMSRLAQIEQVLDTINESLSRQLKEHRFDDSIINWIERRTSFTKSEHF